ncbi:MAG: AMIN domain-containing protein [Burkholderiales bacterium]|nr:AMIN domain-containing protein [Burkholderiales bacterium]
MLLSKPRSWKLLLACLLAVGLLLPATTTAQAASATVSGVKITDGTGTLKVDVQATAPVSFRSKRLTEPRQMVVIDVWPAVLGSGISAQTNVNRGLLEKVRLAQHTPDTVRVYLDVISQPQLQVSPAPERRGLTVAVSTSQIAEAKVTEAPAATTVEATRPVPAQKPVAQTAPAPKPAPQAKVQSRPAAPASVTRTPTSSASALRAQRPRPRPAPPPKTVSIDFVNADLVFVVKALAQEMGRNVFVAPDVMGTVTVTLNKVQPEGALALILKMQENDYSYKIVDGTIVVASPEKLAQIADDILTPRTKSAVSRRNLISQEFLLEVAPAAKVVDFLKVQYPDVEFTQHPTLNGFFAKATRDELRQIKAAIPGLDQVPEPPPAPRREFIPIKYGELRQVQALAKTLVPDLEYNTDDRLNLLIVEGSDASIEALQELLATIDRPQDQVMLDVKVVDLTESGGKNLGITWGSPSAPGSFQTTFGEIVPAIPPAPPGVTWITNDQVQLEEMTGLAIGPFGRTPFVIQTTLAFMITNGEAKILASPRVATQSGGEAKIHVGDKFPIVFFDPRAGQFQVTYVNIGVTLDVKPQVKADGYIVAEVKPEVSNLVDLVNNQYPRTTVRTVSSTMRVKDGDTIVLGGLISESQRHSVSKIPLLGDLPIFGPLFRSVTDSADRNEVILMMTPHIMK